MADTIKYIGTANGGRIITKQQWLEAGFKGVDTLRWNRANNWTISAEGLPDDVLENLKSDETLVFIPGDAKGKAANPEPLGEVPVIGYDPNFQIPTPPTGTV